MHAATTHPCGALADLVRAVTASGGPTSTDYGLISRAFDEVHGELQAGLAEAAQGLQHVRELLADVLAADTMQGFAYRKPHGYAGDFEIIDRIYRQHVCPDERYANWDRFFHAQPAPRAVRNRKAYFHALLDELNDRHPTARVLKVGIGPGRSMYEWMVANPDSGISFECVDIDDKAIAYARALNEPHADRVTFVHQNALRYTTRRKYDLVWSAGLFDYFNDKVFRQLVRRLTPTVARGGEMVVGNFATGNPSRGYMELVGDWHLRHRSAHELLDLARDCGVPASKALVAQEPEGINLFLHLRG